MTAIIRTFIDSARRVVAVHDIDQVVPAGAYPGTTAVLLPVGAIPGPCDDSGLPVTLPEDWEEQFPIPVPDSITARQLRLELLDRGLLGQVETAIDGLPSPQKEAVGIEWEYATVFERASPTLTALAGALDLSGPDVDEMFRAAVRR